MAEIAPFKGIFYNTKIINLKDVVTPPYDVISLSQRERFYQKSPYNIIRIILGKEKNKYIQARRCFIAWQRDRILCQDKNEAIYLYQQRFRIKGERKERFAFLALLKLENLKTGSILPHERTFLQCRKDRYKLLARCLANFSPIFLLYQDPEKRIETELKKETKKISLLEFKDGEEVTHKIWRLTEKNKIRKLISLMKGEKIYIADGHHRYLSALLFHQRNQKRSSSFVLAYFTNIFSPSLSILPVHRLIIPGKRNFGEIRAEMGKFFEIKKASKEMMFKQLQSSSPRHSFGLYLGERKFFLLILKDEKVIENFISKEKATKYLDVAIAHKLLIEHLFKSNEILYSKDEELLIKRVDQEKGKSVAVFLNSVKSAELIDVCGRRKILPPKSTYFYPKIPAGLLIYRFD